MDTSTNVLWKINYFFFKIDIIKAKFLIELLKL